MMIKVHLSKLMGAKRMRMSDIIEETGLYRTGVSNLYYEHSKGIRFDTLEKLCKALDCDISDLLEIVPDSEGTKKDQE